MEAEAEMVKMKMQIQRLSQMIFGSKSERFIANPAQLSLDMAMEPNGATTKLSDVKKISYTSTGKSAPRTLDQLGGYLEGLPRVIEVREPKNLPEGAVKIGEQQHEILEIIRAKVLVKVIITPTYKFTGEHGETVIVSEPAPSRPLPKCVAGPALLAQILTDKFCDHLPIARQVSRFNRDGLSIPYNTLLDWSGKSIDLVSVVYDCLKREILSSPYIHVDETGLKVLIGKEGGNKKHKQIHSGFLWCYNSSRDKLVFFDYQSGRGEKHTHGILKDYKGIIQTDGWQVYENVAEKNRDIIQICCLAHARRKYKDAEPYDKERSEFALKKFKEIYEIERECKEQNLTDDAIKERRQKDAVPILDELHAWMVREYAKLLPSAPMGQAIAYSLRYWDRLCYYITDGMLNPDNNAVENSIRPVSLGRKNFLFAGSEKGAERIAMIYSLIGTCKMNKVNPQDWLADVIGRINEHPINRISELLPHNWKKNQLKNIARQDEQQ